MSGNLNCATIEPLEPRQLLAAGDLVASFGRGGVVDVDSLTAASEVLVQKSGKILVASGDTIYRFRANGRRLDRSFGVRGRLDLDRGITAMALDANDRMLVPIPSGQWGFARYTANGAPDTTLNGTGSVSTQIGDDHWESAKFIGVAPDGKIVLAGTQDNDNDDPDLWDFQKPHDVAVARFNPDGTVDTTFGGTGEHVTRRFENLNAFAVGPRGNVIVAGLFIRGSMNRGGAHEEIGANGRVVSGTDTSAVSGVGSEHFSAGYRADGTRLIGAGSYGWASVWQGDDSEVIHFNPTDRDYAQDSVVWDLAGAGGAGNKVYASGYAGGMSAGAGSGLMRLNANGDLDATFGYGGTVAYDLFRGEQEWIEHMAVLPNGDILAAGRRGGTGVYEPAGGSLFLAKFEGGSRKLGRQRPRAGANLFPPRAGESETRFEVAYAAEQSINRSTIDNRDVVVVGPGGYRQYTRLVEVTDRRDGRAIIATYAVTPPGGTWDDADAGRYQVFLRRRAVRDNFGNAAAAGALGAVDFAPTTTASSRSIGVSPTVVPAADSSPFSGNRKIKSELCLLD